MMVEETTTRFEPALEMVISDLETLKVLADPLRLSILEYLVKPGTVKRVAEKVKKPPTKLYYHFNLLEKHDLIRLVDTRIVSGIIEKHYQAAARYYRVERSLLAPGESNETSAIDMSLSGLFAHTHSEIIRGINDGIILMDPDALPTERLNFMAGGLLLTPDQLVEFQERLNALFKEYQDDITKANEDNPEAVVYKMLLVAYPAGFNTPDSDDELSNGLSSSPAAQDEA